MKCTDGRRTKRGIKWVENRYEEASNKSCILRLIFIWFHLLFGTERAAFETKNYHSLASTASIYSQELIPVFFYHHSSYSFLFYFDWAGSNIFITWSVLCLCNEYTDNNKWKKMMNTHDAVVAHTCVICMGYTLWVRGKATWEKKINVQLRRHLETGTYIFTYYFISDSVQEPIQLIHNKNKMKNTGHTQQKHQQQLVSL